MEVLAVAREGRTTRIDTENRADDAGGWAVIVVNADGERGERRYRISGPAQSRLRGPLDGSLADAQVRHELIDTAAPLHHDDCPWIEGYVSHPTTGTYIPLAGDGQEDGVAFTADELKTILYA